MLQYVWMAFLYFGQMQHSWYA